MRRAAPRYADAVHMVFVHHTDTPNGYAPGDVPAIIRSIYTYHVRSNGWNDIGYNFLVDAYGRVFEGRAGGIDRPVIGAQTQGFNTGSVGIAVIGNGSLRPAHRRRARRAHEADRVAARRRARRPARARDA